MNLKQINTIVPGSMNSFKVDGDLNVALKSWKKSLKDNNTSQEIFDRKYYTKPSIIRKKTMELAKYNQKKENV